MKFGGNDLQVNTHRWRSRIFDLASYSFKMAAMTSYHTQKSAAAWRVNTKRPSARAYTAAYASSWSTVH